MNIEPPGTLDWLLLTMLGIMAGLINALRGMQVRRKTDWLLISIALLSALFAEITTFLILHSLLPVVFGVVINNYGLAAMSAMVAYIGMKQSILLALKIVARK